MNSDKFLNLSLENYCLRPPWGCGRAAPSAPPCLTSSLMACTASWGLPQADLDISSSCCKITGSDRLPATLQEIKSCPTVSTYLHSCIGSRRIRRIAGLQMQNSKRLTLQAQLTAAEAAAEAAAEGSSMQVKTVKIFPTVVHAAHVPIWMYKQRIQIMRGLSHRLI